jgi:ribosomal protein S18 acetylase RimI-like enzyme
MKSYSNFITYLFPEEKNSVYIDRFMSCLVQYGVKFGRIYTSTQYINNENTIKGVCITQSPYSQYTFNFTKLFRIGFFRNLTFKLSHVSSINGFIVFYEKFHQKITNGNPHINLLCLCVDKQFQKNGIGSELLFPILKNADYSNLPIFTMVINPKDNENLKIFIKYDFKVIEKVKWNNDIEIDFLMRKPNIIN